MTQNHRSTWNFIKAVIVLVSTEYVPNENKCILRIVSKLNAYASPIFYTMSGPPVGVGFIKVTV